MNDPVHEAGAQALVTAFDMEPEWLEHICMFAAWGLGEAHRFEGHQPGSLYPHALLTSIGQIGSAAVRLRIARMEQES